MTGNLLQNLPQKTARLTITWIEAASVLQKVYGKLFEPELIPNMPRQSLMGICISTNKIVLLSGD